MGPVTRGSEAPVWAGNWPGEVAQLMDERHLVAYSTKPDVRGTFAMTMAAFLRGLPYAEVCELHGRSITDIESFCTQLGRALPGPAITSRIDGARGVVARLRRRESPTRQPAMYRYYLWHDAEVLLTKNQSLFGRLVDAIIGVGAEAEFASDDRLLIHRALFIGGEALERYAASGHGQFQSWAGDSMGEPFWQAITGIPRPEVLRFQIDVLLSGRDARESA